jgi:hypothetical protein
MEKSRWADDQVDQMSQALRRLRVMVRLPKYSPPMPCPPRRATADGWRDLLEWDPRRGKGVRCTPDLVSAQMVKVGREFRDAGMPYFPEKLADDGHQKPP